MSDKVKLLSPEELPLEIRQAFHRIYDLDCEIADLKAEHIDPVAEQRTATWRTLKGATDITRKDIDLAYKIFRRWKDAAAMEDEAEGRRIQSNIKRLFDACQRGETIDFLQALNLKDHGGDQTGDLAGDDLDDAENFGGGDAGERMEDVEDRHRDQQLRVEIAEEPAAVAGPDADWGDDKAPVPDEQNDGSKEGFAYAAGEAAGREGKMDVKALIKGQGWHYRSSMAKSFAAGHAKGLRLWEADAAKKERDDAIYEANQAGHQAGYWDLDTMNPYDAGTETCEAWVRGYEGGVIRRENEAKHGIEPKLPPEKRKVALFDEGDEETNVVEFGGRQPIPLPTTDVATSAGDVA